MNHDNPLRRFWVGPVKRSLRSAGRNGIIYTLAGKIIDYRRGENDTNFLDNGELDFLRLSAGQLTTVFDVGANVGEWTDLVIRVKPDANIHCFEPIASTFRRLSMKAYPPGVTRHQLGLSSRAGKIAMNDFGEGSPLNSLYDRGGRDLGTARKELADFDTLDAVAERLDIGSIDLLKIDTEGHELEVLRGATRLLQELAVKMVQFEYSSAWIDGRIYLRDVFDLDILRSYRLHKIRPGGLEPIDRYRYDLENYRYANYVLIRNDIAP